MQLGGAFLTLLFVAWPMGPLAGRVAIFDELTTIARFEAIALFAACGAHRQHIVVIRCAHCIDDC